MKQYRTNIMTAIVAIAMMSPSMLHADNTMEDNAHVVSDVKDSGCTSHTRAANGTGLVLTKEGDIVTCELNGYVANCGVDYFDIDSEYKKGTDAPDSLFLKVKPVVPAEMDCTCAYNVSFTIRDVRTNTFYLDCWLYSGTVSFQDSNQIDMTISSEFATLEDGSRYFLFKPSNLAILWSMSNAEIKGEYSLQSSISYEGADYTVVSFYPDALYGQEITKIILPKTIRMIGTGEELRNPFIGFSNLEAIEVEQGCPLLSSVDGVLYSHDHKTLYSLPQGNMRTEFSVIDGVETIGESAFVRCKNLKTIRLPESVTTIRPYAFSMSNNLESIYIPGKLNRNLLYRAFEYMTSTPTLYVLASEVEYFKNIYKGPVFSIADSQGTPSDVTNIHSEDTPSNIYDLQGRRINGKPAKGVYIENGRKRVVK